MEQTSLKSLVQFFAGMPRWSTMSACQIAAYLVSKGYSMQRAEKIASQYKGLN